MHILLTNDDGVFAQGIQILAHVLQGKGGHRVTIAAPDQERSGVSHAFTYAVPLRGRRMELAGLSDITVYAVSGTPVDCVKLAVSNLLDSPPDCLLSGINHGQNLGADTIYSGTVSAATEGALLGIPSMAVSLATMDSGFRLEGRQLDFELAADTALSLLPEFMASGDRLWNLNVPALPEHKVKGIRFTPLAHQVYNGKYIERADPRGNRYYWAPIDVTFAHGPDTDCDIRWVQEGYASVTPLTPDMTDMKALSRQQTKG